MRTWVIALAVVACLALDAGPVRAENTSYLSYYTYYKVRAGDSLESISAQLGVAPQVLRRMNPRLEGDDVQGLGVLCVPARRDEPESVSQEPEEDEEAAPRSAERKTRADKDKDTAEDDLETLSPRELAYLNGYTRGFYSYGSGGIRIEGQPQHRNTFVGSDGRVVTVPTTVPRRVYRQLSSRRGKAIHSVLATARRFMGVPFVWGGEDPSGFDCSGFVQRVFQMHGVSLPRTADIQYEVGRRVVRGKEQPGDLVFFETYLPGASHVGIFIGNDYFIHASSSRGVTVDSLSDSFFRERYLGAKRVL